MNKYEERTYRSLIHQGNLLSYNVKIAESDLLISSDINLYNEALTSLARHRHALEMYIKKRPEFQTSLWPLPEDNLAPPVVKEMLLQAKKCGVGPMAGVAGAISEFVAYDLFGFTENLIIENGGDVFLKSSKDLTVSVFAGESPLSHRINFIARAVESPVGICTSSATVGPSISFGKADAVCVIAQSATLADAAASAIGNRVKNKKDIKSTLDYGMKIQGVSGLIIAFGNEMGAIGDIELV
jgi:hypothetical protein